ncbi:MAG: hypothetical protein ACKO32_10025, partial [Planctomycetia bacterium]
MQRNRWIPALGALAALCLAFPLTAQEQGQPGGAKPAEEKAPPIDVKLPPVLGGNQTDDEIDARLEELIRDVEKQLRNIDRLLENAAAGGSGAGDAAREAGQAAKAMTELMKRSQS